MTRYETSDALTRAAVDFREHYLPHIPVDDTIRQRFADYEGEDEWDADSASGRPV